MWIDPRSSLAPYRLIGAQEGIDLGRREFKTLRDDGLQQAGRIVKEACPELFIRQQPSDEQLNRFLSHPIRIGKASSVPDKPASVCGTSGAERRVDRHRCVSVHVSGRVTAKDTAVERATRAVQDLPWRRATSFEVQR
jgi:hypothetical protein